MHKVSVTELVLNYAEACRNLVPHVDRARVSWRDDEQYDNWDRIAESLFESIVVEPCAYQAAQENALPDLRIARYGFQQAAVDNAHVAVDTTTMPQMICLSTVDTPFDSVRSANGMLSLTNAQFVFVFEAADGTTRRLRTVDLDAK